MKATQPQPEKLKLGTGQEFGKDRSQRTLVVHWKHPTHVSFVFIIKPDNRQVLYKLLGPRLFGMVMKTGLFLLQNKRTPRRMSF